MRVEWGGTRHGLMTKRGIRRGGDGLTFNHHQHMRWAFYGLRFGRRFLGVIVHLTDAQGIEAGTDETRSGSAEGESPVAKQCAQPIDLKG